MLARGGAPALLPHLLPLDLAKPTGCEWEAAGRRPCAMCERLWRNCVHESMLGLAAAHRESTERHDRRSRQVDEVNYHLGEMRGQLTAASQRAESLARELHKERTERYRFEGQVGEMRQTLNALCRPALPMQYQVPQMAQHQMMMPMSHGQQHHSQGGQMGHAGLSVHQPIPYPGLVGSPPMSMFGLSPPGQQANRSPQSPRRGTA